MIILQDTREKEPWDFSEFDFCEAQNIKRLTAGDYEIKGKIKFLTIERKKSVSEIAGNLGIHYDRFLKEMYRMTFYRFRYIICEFSYDKLLMFPKGAYIPKYLRGKIRMNGKFLAKRINEIIDEYGVEFIFCSDRQEAKQKAAEIILEKNELYEQENNQ